MNIIEAMKEVNDGKIVRRNSWFHNIVVMLSSKTGKIVVHNTCTNEDMEYYLPPIDVQADDWVIKHYNRPLTFIEAFKEIKNGKKVRRKAWNDDSDIDINTRLGCLVPSELLANDWEVVE